MRDEFYADTCTVHCTDKNEDLEVDVNDFRKGAYLSVSIQRTINVNMKYMPKHDIYVGSYSGLEFTTKGPKLLG